jgi:hypothetical protein
MSLGVPKIKNFHRIVGLVAPPRSSRTTSGPPVTLPNGKCSGSVPFGARQNFKPVLAFQIPSSQQLGRPPGRLKLYSLYLGLWKPGILYAILYAIFICNFIFNFHIQFPYIISIYNGRCWGAAALPMRKAHENEFLAVQLCLAVLCYAQMQENILVFAKEQLSILDCRCRTADSWLLF